MSQAVSRVFIHLILPLMVWGLLETKTKGPDQTFRTAQL